jgi:glutathione S-transferase
VFKDSESILRYADGYLEPAQQLFASREITAFCRELDAGLGPDGRRLIYKHMLPRKRLMLPYNNAGVPAREARALTALWPLAKRWATRELQLTDTDEAPLVLAAFDAVAERLGGREYLFEDRFTAADLTFASLAAAVVLPPEYGTPLPRSLPEPVARDVRRFREHPAGAFALRLFRELRHSSAGAGSGA